MTHIVDQCFNHVQVNLGQPPLAPLDLLNADATGSDWLTDGDALNLDAWLFEPVQQTANRFAGQPNGPNVDPRIYLGRRAMRQVAREVLTRLDANARATLTRLKLRGWHGRGFTRFSTSLEDPNAAALLAERVEIRDDGNNRLRTRPPGRVNVATPTTSNPGQPMWEPIDSSFVDVTLLSDRDDMDMSDGFYVGVFNRRTNPLMTFRDQNGQLQTEDFQVYNDLLTAWDADTTRLYAQAGAREVRLPFRVPHDAQGRYRLLRVTELGQSDPDADDSYPLRRARLDTVIGQDRDLDVMLLPGEGRIFQVRFEEAESRVRHTNDAGRGWLDHNTQRKLVIHPDIVLEGEPPAPVIDESTLTFPACSGNDGQREFNRQIRVVRDGPNWRYHMVYHRRVSDDDLQAPGPLTVFYRRSVALQNLPVGEMNAISRGTLEWEQEINISALIAEGGGASPSCAYPSIVVRYDQVRRMNVVYIVYACERQGTGQNDDIAIYESQVPADPARFEQIDEMAQPPFRPMMLDVVRSSGFDANERLHHWGTPVINASADGNYYAWSDHLRGIVYGYKVPDQRTFVATGGLRWIKAKPAEGGQNWVAKYPTMTSYARLRLGERDAAMAWQEGPDLGDGIGKAIFYTRLRFDGGQQQVVRYLTPAPVVNNMTLDQTNPVDNTNALLDLNRVLQVSQTAIGVNGRHEKPTLLRMQSEFPDNFVAGAPLIGIGHYNHKPERIVWESTFDDRPATTAFNMTALSHRVVDVTDRCNPGVNGGTRTTLWTTPEGRVFSWFYALRQPELLPGEMKQSLNLNPSVVPQYNPSSWDYDDTTLVLAFSALWGDGSRHDKLYQLTYGYDLYASSDIYELHGWIAPGVSTKASMRVLAHPGRSPHAAARHTVVHAQGLSKGRRIYEEANGPDNTELRAGYARAPFMMRTNEGFFKQQIDNDGTTTVPMRRWIGFSGADGHAEVAELKLNGADWNLGMAVAADVAPDPRRPLQFTTQWASIDDVSALEMQTWSSIDADGVEMFIERESDGAKVPFVAFNGRRKNAWMLIPDPVERYRLVMECTNNDLGPVVDLEVLDDEPGTLERTDAEQLIDLRRIGSGLDAYAALPIEVWPQPASDMLNVITQVGRTSQLGTLTIRDVRGTVVLQVPCKTIDLLQIPTTGMPSGTYSATLDVDGQTLGRTLVSIVR